MRCLISCLQYVAICLILLVTAQSVEPIQFYFDAFETQSDDWKIENNGAGVNSVKWTDNTGCNDLGGSLCLYMPGQGLVSRVVSTVGYHSIKIYIDNKAYSNDWESGLGEWEYCYLQYRSTFTSWSNTNLLTGSTYQLDIEITVPDTDDYNNQPSFEIRLGHGGDAGGDSCWFDDLRVFGIPYTDNPTTLTTDPTNAPTPAPTEIPTSVPTASTNHPSVVHTSNPSIDPTNVPTPAPSEPPTIVPTEQPSSVSTYISSIYRTSSHTSIHSTTTGTIIIDVYHNDLANEGTIFVVLLVIVIFCCISVCICYYIAAKYFMDDPNKNVEHIERNIANNNGGEEVREWLRDIVKMEQYLDNFVNNGYELLAFVRSIQNVSELEAIGIVLKKDQELLMEEIVILRKVWDISHPFNDIDDAKLRNISNEMQEQILIDNDDMRITSEGSFSANKNALNMNVNDENEGEFIVKGDDECETANDPNATTTTNAGTTISLSNIKGENP